jgi:spermidine synthase
MRNRLLIISVFVVASCGLAYELIAGALASYLLGDSIFQFSSIIGAYLFAMGVGSHLSKYVPEERVLDVFVEIELLVGLIGGFSALMLFLAFGWVIAPFRTMLYALVVITGILVGMEIPLVMRVMNKQKVAFSELVSQVLTFDYLGALVVSLLFPLVLAPKLGISRTALMFGVLNVVVALLAVRVFWHQLSRPMVQVLRGGVALILLVGGVVMAERMVHWSEQQYFGDEVVFTQNTPYQKLVMTRWKDDSRLYINGNLQFSTRDEYRYHEALVHPVMAKLPWAKRILVLGGGDGLAVREVLKYPQIEEVTLVDLDPAMTDLFKTNAQMVALNQGSLNHPKTRVINADAARWLEENKGFFDVIIIDFPDPSNFSLGKLYSVPMYRMVKEHLADNGLVVVQSTSPYHAPRSFWSINATLKEANFYTSPYHTYVPSFGEWGFIIAANHPGYDPPTTFQVPLRFLDAEMTRLMFQFPLDMKPWDSNPNYLNTQELVHYFEEDWRHVIR